VTTARCIPVFVTPAKAWVQREKCGEWAAAETNAELASLDSGFRRNDEEETPCAS
jgi:hypothetical protein